MSKRYVFEQDPGHGWLGVPLNELQGLAIDDQVSRYSYWEARTQTVWLEEDCDMGLFIRAMAGIEGVADADFRDWVQQDFFALRTEDRREGERIRRLPSFVAADHAQPVNPKDLEVRT